MLEIILNHICIITTASMKCMYQCACVCVLHLAGGRESISVRVSLCVCERRREKFYICESICVCVCWFESRSSVFASWAQVTHWRAITACCPLRGPWCPAGSVCECVRDSGQRADGCLCPAASASLLQVSVGFLFSSHSSSHTRRFSSCTLNI